MAGGGGVRVNTPDVFLGRIDTSGGPDACFPYTGRLKPPGPGMEVGHGVYDHDGTWDYAHRYMWFLVHGVMPELDVLHTCDNPPCCNLRHLYLGTDLENARDREGRGRRNVQGRRHPNAVLSDEQVLAIRDEPGSLKEVAAKYGIGWSMVSKIRNRVRWGHL